MMTLLGTAAALATLVLIGLLLPLLMAPLVLLLAVVERITLDRPRRRSESLRPAADVHQLPAIHPTDRMAAAA